MCQLKRKFLKPVKRARHLAILPLFIDQLKYSSWKFLLKKDIDRLGSKDELVEVKNGYGRNFLMQKDLQF